MKIKEKPEDFIVKEELDLKLGEGNYFYYLLEKKDWNTLNIIKEISKRLKIKEKDIGFAGNKDKKAITFQYISILNGNPERVSRLKIEDAKLSFVGRGKDRICLGDLKGNNFIIIVRDCSKIKNIKNIINYFGEQRFGLNNNWKIGKMLILKKFKEACEELSLEVDRNDYLGALKKLGLRKLRFYVSSYQSYLWNKLAEKSKEKKIPIVGYLYDGKLYDKILEEEEVKVNDFLIRSFKEISTEGGERDRLIKVEKFKAKELEKGIWEVSFFLQKGAYATEVIRQLNL